MTLHSGDREAVRRVLRSGNGPSAALVPHVIPLLAWDDVSEDCIRALRSVAEQQVGELIDALVDPQSALCGPSAIGPGVLGLHLPARRRRSDPRSRRPALRGALSGRTIASGDHREEPGDSNRQGAASSRSSTKRSPSTNTCGRTAGCLTRVKTAMTVHFSRSWSGPGRAGAWRTCSRCSRSCCQPNRCVSRFAGCTPMIRRCGARPSSTWTSVLPHEIRDRLWLFLEDRRMPSKVRRPREETLGDLLRSTRLDQAEPRRTEATRRRSQEHLMTAEARGEAAIPVRRRDRQHLLLRPPRRRIGSSSESTTRSGSNRALRRTSTESSPWVLVAAEDKMSLGRRFPAPGLAQSQLAKPRRLLDH